MLEARGREHWFPMADPPELDAPTLLVVDDDDALRHALGSAGPERRLPAPRANAELLDAIRERLARQTEQLGGLRQVATRRC